MRGAGCGNQREQFTCARCCSQCTPFYRNETWETNNFTDLFVYTGSAAAPPAVDADALLGGNCACLDVTGDSFATGGLGVLTLTDKDDCLIVRGDSNVAWGQGGNDLLIAIGDRPRR